jgi:DNA-binding MarR family transcriptional regulator
MSSGEPLSAQRLSLLLEQLVRMLRTVASQGGITPTTAAVLSRLTLRGPMRITELARSEGVTQPAMTQLVARMESEQLVSRTTVADDRRSVLVTPTDHGRRVLDERRARRTAFLEELITGLDTDERAAIAAALPALERLVDSQPASDSPLPDQRRPDDTPSHQHGTAEKGTR